MMEGITEGKYRDDFNDITEAEYIKIINKTMNKKKKMFGEFILVSPRFKAMILHLFKTICRHEVIPNRTGSHF